MKWKLVPEEPTKSMIVTAVINLNQHRDVAYIYKSMLDAAPQPEHDRMTKEEAQAMQDWKGMDGSIAFHLIERHADGWNQIGEMMNAWLEANKDWKL